MTESEEAAAARRAVLAGARRMVIKVGTRLLTDMANQPKRQRIGQLVAEIARLRAGGREVVVVSSGAIGAGMVLMAEPKRPRDLSQLQALAAVGQCRLMAHYEAACETHGFHCGQMLLTGDDFKNRQRHLNLCNCLNALLARGVLPVINENDTVCVDEIRVGDNDRLAAYVAVMIRADLTLLLTTEDGLRRRENGELRERIPLVRAISDAVRGMAGRTDGNRFSVGGMTSKITAAEICTTSGEPLWIADGRDFGVLRRVAAGEDVGTLFLPRRRRLTAAKRYLAFFSVPRGELQVDAGAALALRDRGTSLLPRGVTLVTGKFALGDTVRITDPAGVEVGMGITNYDCQTLDRIKGQRSAEIATALGSASYKEAVHRDNLVIWHPN